MGAFGPVGHHGTPWYSGDGPTDGLPTNLEYAQQVASNAMLRFVVGEIDVVRLQDTIHRATYFLVMQKHHWKDKVDTSGGEPIPGG